ncbi:MAG: hypothetical protein DRI61_08035 [Chloroflexi bacterium]|nr:MAG: hypothetical protein DRI61_08035 [Chloroflexota bacterium]
MDNTRTCLNKGNCKGCFFNEGVPNPVSWSCEDYLREIAGHTDWTKTEDVITLLRITLDRARDKIPGSIQFITSLIERGNATKDELIILKTMMNH